MVARESIEIWPFIIMLYAHKENNNPATCVHGERNEKKKKP
jgi:hypothetical protein